ncbi:MAG TPA: hypothetical protein DEH25_10540 [Chloroflexi bacterium]|nr:hypothetical protein [Chloroflexota bacterium]
MDPAVKSNRILPATRWLAALVIPFLVVAFVILYLFPSKTEQLFAWKLQPQMSAMMLGAAYAGGVYFFSGVLLLKKWHRVKVGFLPVMSFATLLGIATVLHWDRFNHAHISFYAWAGLYFTTPFLVFAVWWRNRSQDSGKIALAADASIPRWIRWGLGIVGAVTLLISLLLFFQPNLMMGVWPWTLTPLTARVVGAMFALPGLVGLGIARDERWSAARLILQSQAFSIALILVACVRAWGEFGPLTFGTVLFVGGLTALLIGIVGFYAYMESLFQKFKK